MFSIGRMMLISLLTAVLGISMLTTGCGSSSGSGSSGGGATPTPTPTPSGTPSASSLKGTYAFYVWGTPLAAANSGTFIGIAGSFVADGRGNITSGIEDVYLVDSTNSLNTQPSLTISGGSYTINNTGVGQVTLTAQNPTYSAVLGVSLLSPNAALISRLDNFATAYGKAYLQTTSDFALSHFASSAYVFNGIGVDAPNGTTVAHAGVFPTDVNGNIAAGGVEDYNDGGVATSDQSLDAAAFTISSATTSNGRITDQLSNGTTPFAAVFYIVDDTHMVFLEAQGSALTAVGEVYQQAKLSTTTPNSIVDGGYVFNFVTPVGTSPFVMAGQAVFDGSAGNISSGVLDSNVNGTVHTDVALTAGTGGTTSSHYQIDSKGRGTLELSSTTLGNMDFNFYPSIQGLAVIEMDSSTASGTMFAQGATSFTNSSIDGNYAVSIFGANGTTGPFAGVGELISNGSGSFSSGTLSVDNDSTSATGAIGTSTYSSIDATTGRATFALADSTALPATINGVLYVIGPPTATTSGFLFMETDTDQLSVGQAFTQGGF